MISYSFSIVSTILSAEYISNYAAMTSNNVAPHVFVRVSRTVAKSIFHDKHNVISEVLTTTNKVWKNWKLSNVSDLSFGDEIPSGSVESITIGYLREGDGVVLSNSYTVSCENTHFYKLCEDGAMSQSISADAESEDSSVGSLLWQLPCVEFEHILENLMYDSDLKIELMGYIHTLIMLSERGANMNIINVNRLILLLGPPGTGKTSLCKGIAQHLSIRMNHRFSSSVLVEINSHSLFSKWFSESGKLVLRMFDQIDELADDGKCLVFVLIDEVESLGMSRNSCQSRGDPADSIRAVNALLTQIDRIRRRSNVFVFCTSNLEDCLDNALVDRADLVKTVGPPSRNALYGILDGCIQELIRIGLVEPVGVDADFSDLSLDGSQGDHCLYRKELLSICESARGISGRSVRQLPALALSMIEKDVCSIEELLASLRKSVEMKQRSNTK